MKHISFIQDYIDSHQKEYTAISDTIWEYAETRFQEHRSSRLQQEYLRQQGFSIRAGLAGEDTAFIAQYGNGSPVIAIMGEFDALEGMSQKADCTTLSPLQEGAAGHGCGHNLLGVGALAAACALKAYMEQAHLPGTVRYYGCPAEENAGGKAFLVRDGFFDDCDIAISWHPFAYDQVVYGSSNANYRVFFTFHGTPAHASNSPHLGRSALDAVELMDIGVNYMREHMIDEARVHYAITDTGGKAPNVVQSQAQVLYAIRAPKVTQVHELFQRICSIAEGAAMMTGTSVEIKQVAAYSNMVSNQTICKQMEQDFAAVTPISYSEDELEYARRFFEALSAQNKKDHYSNTVRYFGPVLAKEQAAQPIFTALADHNKYESMKGSADMGDVSWNIPTAYFYGVTWAAGTPTHSWQAVAQGKSSIAHKGMLHAAKVLAATGYAFLTDPELIRKAKEELITTLNGEVYPNPLPKDCVPELW